jgi:translation initiation factor 3 subunit F
VRVVEMSDGSTKKELMVQAKTIGALLGTYERGAINITGAFAVPYGTTQQGNQQAELQLDMQYLEEMLEYNKKTKPYEGPVGWFTTTHMLESLDVNVHDYFMGRINKWYQRTKDVPAVVCLMLNCDQLDKAGKTDPIVYIKTSTGIPFAKDPHTSIFHRINVDVTTYRAEQVVLDVALKGIESKGREVRMSDGVTELAAGISEMSGWLETIGRYVDDVIAGKTTPDPLLGRRLMEAMAYGSQMTSKQMDKIVNGSIRDHLMIAYLSQVAKTQLALYEKMVAIV